MKPFIIFGIIVVLGFLGISMLSNQNKTQPENNFLSPTPSPSPLLSAPSPFPTVPENARITADSATIKTAKGNIEVELYASEAARTVMNFATLAKRGYYDNLAFHRVESWVIQGGDPTGTGAGGESIYGETFEDEINPNTSSYKTGYVEGILAMANRGPNTNGSQFFILTRTTPLEPNYTIFGKVTKGMEIAKKIQKGDKILTIEAK